MNGYGYSLYIDTIINCMVIMWEKQ